MFKGIKVVALDINGTLISGRYRRWDDIFEGELGLERHRDTQSSTWYDAQTGKISFEEAVSHSYSVYNLETLRERAFKAYMRDLELRDGCLDLLEDLQGKYELAVCSDTSGITKVIARVFGLEKYFTKFFYSIDVGWMKSDLEFWNIFLSNFTTMSPNELIMVGDNPQCDVHWPNVLGMGTIQIETTEILSMSDLEVRDDNYDPDHLISSLREITQLLNKYEESSSGDTLR